MFKEVVFPFLFFFICSLFSYSQGILELHFKDKSNNPLIEVEIYVLELDTVIKSGERSVMEISLPAGSYTIRFRHPSYLDQTRRVSIREGQVTREYIVLSERVYELETQEIRGQVDPRKTQEIPFFQVIPIEPRRVGEMPAPKSDIESQLVLLPGVGTASEFSSQYRVRGGNYDENLIYVNGIEVYRPQLIRQGQQEGLGFTNVHLAEEVRFSSGGFSAEYGDKMASVLDVTYRTPKRKKATIELGLLTTNIHVEDRLGGHSDSSGIFTYQMGLRRYSTRYLLRSLQVQGTFRPVFYDIQAFFTYKPVWKGKRPLTISLLVYGASNDYYFEPQSQETTFGTFNRAFRLFVAFVGKERTLYQLGQTAVKVDYVASSRWRLQTIYSFFVDYERELTDVEGGYRLSDVNTNFGSSEYNQEVYVRGIGSELAHRRNYLLAYIHSSKWNFLFTPDVELRHLIKGGLEWRRDYLFDEFREWSAIDSADYLTVKEYVNAENSIQTDYLIGYLQHRWQIWRVFYLQYGIRAVWRSLNGEFFWVPRVQLIYDLSRRDNHSKPIQIRFGAGGYYQPPFYREMRDFNGLLYRDVRAQRAYHFILGLDYLFKVWERPFKFTGEAYYKLLSRLIPFEFQNVRIRYYPQFTATGYVRGIDLRLNGEFLQGLDSWLSVSILEAKENVNGIDSFVYRPTDQRFIVSFYFQDYLPQNPTIRFGLKYLYNSGLPFGPPKVLQNRTVFRMPSYQRVDLSVSKLITLRDSKRRKGWHLQSIWIGLEVYNVFGRFNTIAYQWVKDVYNTYFAVPNYLSARLYNARIIAYF